MTQATKKIIQISIVFITLSSCILIILSIISVFTLLNLFDLKKPQQETLAESNTNILSIGENIRKSSANVLKVAIPSIKTLSTNEEEPFISEMIRKELSSCINFQMNLNVIDSGNYSDYADEYGITSKDVQYSMWSKTGADFLLLGGIRIEKDMLIAELRLFDLSEKKLLVGKRYKGTTWDCQRIVDRFCTIMRISINEKLDEI